MIPPKPSSYSFSLFLGILFYFIFIFTYFFPLGFLKVFFLLCLLSVCLALDISDYSVDDECLVKLLKGCCLKNLQRPLQAELCFNHVIQRYKRARRLGLSAGCGFQGVTVRKQRVPSHSECSVLPGKESSSALFVLGEQT